MTHLHVAAVSGVSRATLYRHWPDPSDLLLEGLAQIDEPLLHFGDGPLREWLVDELERTSVELGQPESTKTLVALVGGALRDPAVGQVLDHLLERTEAPLVRALTAAELGRDADASALLAALLGPIVFRVMIQRRAAGRPFIERVVDTTLVELCAA